MPNILSTETLRIPIFPPEIKPLPKNIPRPLWSVMVPTYNCIQFVVEAIESVLQQDLGAEVMQIEIIDDFSDDGDLEKLINEHYGDRVHFFRQDQNKGSLRNFETCINRAKGEYVHILHGDDRVKPGFYKQVAELFEIFPDAGAAFTNYSYINHLSKVVDIDPPLLLKEKGIIPDFLFKLAEKQLVQPPAIVVKRSVYEDLGSFYAVHYGEDWEMWTRIASRYPIAFSPACLAMYRVSHGIGISHNYFLSGKNITDIVKVVDIIQTYLPAGEREKYKKLALDYYAIYIVKIGNDMLLKNKTAAFKQVSGAWQMSKNAPTAYWILRFYLMHLFRFKQLEAVLNKIKWP